MWPIRYCSESQLPGSTETTVVAIILLVGQIRVRTRELDVAFLAVVHPLPRHVIGLHRKFTDWHFLDANFFARQRKPLSFRTLASVTLVAAAGRARRMPFRHRRVTEACEWRAVGRAWRTVVLLVSTKIVSALERDVARRATLRFIYRIIWQRWASLSKHVTVGQFVHWARWRLATGILELYSEKVVRRRVRLTGVRKSPIRSSRVQQEDVLLQIYHVQELCVTDNARKNLMGRYVLFHLRNTEDRTIFSRTDRVAGNRMPTGTSSAISIRKTREGRSTPFPRRFFYGEIDRRRTGKPGVHSCQRCWWNVW